VNINILSEKKTGVPKHNITVKEKIVLLLLPLFLLPPFKYWVHGRFVESYEYVEFFAGGLPTLHTTSPVQQHWALLLNHVRYASTFKRQLHQTASSVRILTSIPITTLADDFREFP
jgi:hypothetical protein